MCGFPAKFRVAYIGLLAIAFSALAADPPAISYDAKKAQALREQERQWFRATTLDSYTSVGKHSPKWDDVAKRALQANAERVAGSPWAQADASVTAKELFEQAAKAGCDDPLVVYFQLRTSRRDTDAATKKEYLSAARTLAASKYPDIRKAQAWLNAIAELQFAPKGEKPEDADLIKANECLDQLLKLLSTLAKQKDANLRKEVIELCELIPRNGSDIGKRQEWFDRLEAEVLSKLPKDDSLPHLIAGMFFVNYAWDARGDGPGITVTAEGGRLFRERLEEAETQLTKAWELDKTNSRAAARLITVCTGLGRDRDVMEEWFRKALEANPNEQTVYIAKMKYIHPNWHGTKEDVIEFGRQMAKSPNWESRVPTFLAKAHYEIAAFTSDFAGYFREQPEVWKEIEPVLEEMRRRYPKSRLGASWYMYYAWISNRNAAQALTYSQAVGDDIITNPFRNRAEVNEALSWAKTEAAKAGKKK
jgi:hypothetical protein